MWQDRTIDVTDSKQKCSRNEFTSRVHWDKSIIPISNQARLSSERYIREHQRKPKNTYKLPPYLLTWPPIVQCFSPRLTPNARCIENAFKRDSRSQRVRVELWNNSLRIGRHLPGMWQYTSTTMQFWKQLPRQTRGCRFEEIYCRYSVVLSFWKINTMTNTMN